MGVYVYTYLIVAGEGDGVSGLLAQYRLLRLAVQINLNGSHGTLELDRQPRWLPYAIPQAEAHLTLRFSMDGQEFFSQVSALIKVRVGGASRNAQWSNTW